MNFEETNEYAKKHHIDVSDPELHCSSCKRTGANILDRVEGDVWRVCKCGELLQEIKIPIQHSGKYPEIQWK